jgi:hypothetical protein
MTVVALSQKTKKLVTLCEAEGFRSLDDLLRASMSDVVCPAICMVEGCDHIERYEKDQEEGYCEACGSNTVTSALILAELI